MSIPIGRLLNRMLGTGASHALYREDGGWYERLERFPGILFDRNGYVVFDTRHAYENCRQLRHGKKLNVTGGISSLPGYVRDKRIAEYLRA
jgi:hypothetical protein